MKNDLSSKLIALKAKGFPASKVEKDLGLFNGLLGKISKGERKLTGLVAESFEKYFNEKMGIQPPIEKTQTVVTLKGELKKEPTKEAMDKLKSVMDDLNKRFGAGTVMRLGDKPREKYKTISTGSVGLDLALGIGGMPRGRIVELYGWESSGKSTIAINAVADAQKQGLKCLWVDAESAFDADYAIALGVNIEDMEYCQPTCGEEALDVAESYIRSGEVGLVVIDSVAALVPKGEVSGTHGESKMGLHARLMSQACRKLTALISKSNTLVIFINQLRHKIGGYGNPEVTTGGNALKFYASMRMDVSRSTSKENSLTDDDGNKEGNLTTVKVAKNKCAAPFKKATFNIIYGVGIDRIGEIFELALSNTLIKKEGRTFSINGTKLGVGEEEAKQFLNDNPEYAESLVTKIKSA